MALDEVGREAVLAVTAAGDVHTSEDLDAAREAAARLGARHLVVRTEELAIPALQPIPPSAAICARGSCMEC